MSVPAYPSYKDSGVAWLGDVPATWQVGRVKDHFEIKKRIAGRLGYDVLSITQSGIRVRDTNSNDGQLSMDYSKYQIVYPGDFAMNHMDLITGWVDISKQEGVTSPDYRVFSPRFVEEIDCKYFLYVFQMAYSQRQFYPFGQGSSHLGRWRLPTDAFYGFSVPCPARQEQTAIAAFLDRETGKIDALVEEQRRLIALLKEKRQAVISHAITNGLNPQATLKPSGIEWLGDIPAHWQVRPLRAVSTEPGTVFIDGDWIEAKDISDEGIRYITTGNVGEGRYKEQGAGFITEEKFRELNCTEVLPEDVLISRLNAPVGRACIVPNLGTRIVTSVDNVIVRPDRSVHRAFLVHFLSTKSYLFHTETLARGTTMQRVSRTILGNIRIAMPGVDEQREIADYISREIAKLDALIDEAERGTSLLQERRAALISAAVTGKIDVRGLVATSGALEAA